MPKQRCDLYAESGIWGSELRVIASHGTCESRQSPVCAEFSSPCELVSRLFKLRHQFIRCTSGLVLGDRRLDVTKKTTKVSIAFFGTLQLYMLSATDPASLLHPGLWGTGAPGVCFSASLSTIVLALAIVMGYPVAIAALSIHCLLSGNEIVRPGPRAVDAGCRAFYAMWAVGSEVMASAAKVIVHLIHSHRTATGRVPLAKALFRGQVALRSATSSHDTGLCTGNHLIGREAPTTAKARVLTAEVARLSSMGPVVWMESTGGLLC